jgi:hypothetical protein
MHPEKNLICANANLVADLFAPESVGLISIFNVLYHLWIENELDILRGRNYILRPGGTLIITEPAFRILMRNHDVQALGKTRYSLKEFDRLLEKAGFELLVGTYWNSASFLPALLLTIYEKIALPNDAIFYQNNIAELKLPGKTINRLILNLLNIERLILQIIPKIPIGVSLLCIARKK